MACPRPSRRAIWHAALIGTAFVGAAPWAFGWQAAESAPTVGMPARIDQLVLPGTELEAKPREDRDAAVIVRVVDVYPHGTAFRYDIEYVGFEPGERDLRAYLRRKDGSTADDLPPIPVTIRASLPPGQILPHEPRREGVPRLGGYKLFLGLGLALWTAGLIILAQRGRHRRAAALVEAARPVTLADRLKPLVESAVEGRLEPQRLAELERLLIGYWSARLGLSEMAPVDALRVLRGHPEAGPLLETLEAWLHRPGGNNSVDVHALLEPYRSIAADALESPAPAAGGTAA